MREILSISIGETVKRGSAINISQNMFHYLKHCPLVMCFIISDRYG